MFNCEPFSTALEPVQCYKCWQWGHTQRYCRKEAICPRCSTHVHGNGGKEGEAQCPTHKGIACKCPVCGGSHTAWAKDCPKGVEAKQKAREAYEYRPRSFESNQRTKTSCSSDTVVTPNSAPARQNVQLLRRTQVEAVPEPQDSDEGEEEVFQEARRKRARGRPTGLENAAQSPTQKKLMFSTVAKTHTQPVQLTPTQQSSQDSFITFTQSTENSASPRV